MLFLFILLTAVSGAISITSGYLTIRSAITSHPGTKPQQQRFGWGLTIGTFLLALLFLFAGLLSPQGSNNPTLTPGNSPTTTGSPSTQAPITSNPNLPYVANWSNGLNGWAGTSQWRAQGGMLVSDGSNGYAANDILAPVQMGQISDYTVTASIQIISCPTTVSDCSIGILVRQATYNGEQNGYVGAVDNFRDDHYIPSYADIHTGSSNACRSCAIQPIQYTYYTPDHNSHTYQVTVRGTHISFSIDGNVIVQVDDTSFAMGGQAGLEDTNAQIAVSSFQVSAL